MTEYKGLAIQLLEQYDSVQLLAAAMKILTGDKKEASDIHLTPEDPIRAKRRKPDIRNGRKPSGGYGGRGNSGGYRRDGGSGGGGNRGGYSKGDTTVTAVVVTTAIAMAVATTVTAATAVTVNRVPTAAASVVLTGAETNNRHG